MQDEALGNKQVWKDLKKEPLEFPVDQALSIYKDLTERPSYI